MVYQPIVGLEVHVELKTKSKMFCSCFNDPDERHPNINICPVCTAQPGSLPVINKEAVKKVIKTGLALNCRIPEYSKFDRKNYFYPDLPKGYQISQLYQPLCKEGFLEMDRKKIRIREVHLEEDTGRLIHPVRGQRALGEAQRKQTSNGVHPVRGQRALGEVQRKQTSNGVHPEETDYSLVDFNRAGIPLMELVTEPDLSSAKEARHFAEELHLILHYLDISDADMEKGQMRIEVNLSLSKKEGELGTKVEIKNLNSFRAVERAAEYEIKRQTELLESGKKISQETRGWDDIKGVTVSQRKKEEANDYRYFPEPDLPPLHIGKKEIDEIRAEIPELPRQRRKRFEREYELDEKSIKIFVYNKALGEYFEKVVSEFESNLPRKKLFKSIKLATNYLITDLQGLLKNKDFLTPLEKKSLTGRVTAENFSQFIALIEEGKISSKIAKIVFQEMFKTGADPSHIIEERGLIQIVDEAKIEKIIEEVILKNRKAVEDFKLGKENSFQFLIGQVMAATKGKANPEMVNRILRKNLNL